MPVVTLTITQVAAVFGLGFVFGWRRARRPHRDIVPHNIRPITSARSHVRRLERDEQ